MLNESLYNISAYFKQSHWNPQQIITIPNITDIIQLSFFRFIFGWHLRKHIFVTLRGFIFQIISNGYVARSIFRITIDRKINIKWVALFWRECSQNLKFESQTFSFLRVNLPNLWTWLELIGVKTMYENYGNKSHTVICVRICTGDRSGFWLGDVILVLIIDDHAFWYLIKV